jgi:hypothetical protein
MVKSSAAVEGVYFVLYLGEGASPDVRIAISRTITSLRPDLPQADADRSLRAVSRIPFGALEPGVYEITVTAAQSGAAARGSMAIEVE